MVVNPTANTYDLDELVIDGFPVIEYTNYQLYAPNGDVYSTSYSSVTESNRLSFRPYSSSLIQFEYNNQSKESGASIKSIDEKKLNIYPNPNNGNFVIDILLQSSAENMKEDANQAATIQVFNLLGQMVITETIPIVDGVLFKEMKLGSMVATGMYSVRVIFDDEIHQSQVIYQR